MKIEIQIAFKDDDGEIEIIETDKMIAMIGGTDKNGGMSIVGEYSIPELLEIQSLFRERLMMLVTAQVAKMSGASEDDIEKILDEAPMELDKERFMKEIKRYL